jgi:hypothetical protein
MGTVDVNQFERYKRKNRPFDKLYMVDTLEIDPNTPPAVKEYYLTNYEAKESYTNDRDEWLHTALKDVRVIVNYKDAQGNVPPPKYIVLDPKRNKNELPMDKHLLDWPRISGSLDVLYPVLPAADPDLGVDKFVFVHLNDERYWDLNMVQVAAWFRGNHTNPSGGINNWWALAGSNSSYTNVKWATSEPVKVYVLGEGEVSGDGGELVAEPKEELVFVTRPIRDWQKNVETFLNNYTFTVTYTYVNPMTGEPEGEPILYEVDVNDPRLEFYGGGFNWYTYSGDRQEVHRKHIVINNDIRQQGTGIYDPSIWQTEGTYTFSVRYIDTSGVAVGEDVMELEIEAYEPG